MGGPPEGIKEAEECPKNADNCRFSPVHYSYLEEADRHCNNAYPMPLRGSIGTLFQSDNRNFLKLVELFGKFDSVMMEHLHGTKQDENKGHHYLEKESQNEITHLIGSSITNNILLMMKSAKYYSIILDCTPDISKFEQTTVVVILKFLEDKKILLLKSLNDFSFSVLCWDVLKYLPNLSLKPLSDTRSESRIDALIPQRFQIGGVYDALVQISEEFDERKKSLCLFDGFQRISYRIRVRRSNVNTDVSSQWSKKPILFTYEGRDETIDDPTKHYKIEFYYYILDIVTTYLDERFNQLKSHCYFDFIYDIGKLKNAPPDSLDTKCRNLSAIFQDHESSNINALELREELKVLSTALKPRICPKETLKSMGRHNFCPNVNTALRILLTLTVTAASRERSFSKLKLINTYRFL
ncbi:uncharacterized protein LOC124776295 [Schistocerca piceifrons]|uniref:uncharacterized protein LOC124776295 n=1 Tax=Schistocerca piceifrons TaxID=274613 RepID=UPI001F5F23FB|nr:uncharacterized protein LOC124776295 [Schistocerca piceifrons]